ncbi:2-phospho-L-lactate transferase [Diaminobutyricimonas sp. LJ205]|uniref:2-phospho-L-lactate transferase n=1 Tax=Diaminobutyricimonas sp. LJ205 TaxID=2683590 RepID=UPI0012F4B040|nr:2-phospho-L-lactate transferase [Diaminobutyricimonas sp. LJ205]
MSGAALKIAVLAGGVGGAKFVRGLRHAAPDADISVVVNTGDDMWLAGVRVCPDLDSIMYALAGVNDAERGWGRAGESERVAAELTAYGVGWPWFTLGDLDLGTHLARTSLLRDGLTLTEATARLSARWDLGVRLLPMSDQRVETHVRTAEGLLHFEEWWVRTRAQLPALGFEQVGVAEARPTDAVLETLATADVVVLAPSNPVVSIGTILGVPGLRAALMASPAPVVGVSPIIGGAALRGMAAECLSAIGVDVSADAVARHYGARSGGGLLDGWLVDDADASVVPRLGGDGIRTVARPLYLSSLDESAAIARAALDLARG